MAGNHSRMKGYRYEAEIVRFMEEGGIPARRHFMSGLYEKGDITLAPACGPLKGECKRRKCLPEWMGKALGTHDFVAMREDRGETYVLMRLERFRDLLQ